MMAFGQALAGKRSSAGAWYLIRRLASLVAAVLVTSCGGGVDKAPTAPAMLRAAALEDANPPSVATVTGSPLTAAEALDWAEERFPSFFPPANKVNGFASPYTFRYYPGSDTFLAVATASEDVAIYLYGAANGWQLRRLGALADFTCIIKPQSCVEPEAYVAGSFSVTGDKDAYVHDPVRNAIYAVSRAGNAVYKYHYAGGSWAVTALPMTEPLNLGLTFDGGRLFVALSDSVKEVNPDTMAIKATYPVPFRVNWTYGSPLAVSADGKLWLPGNYFAGQMYYLDLNDNTIKQLRGASNIESASFTGAADGSVVLVSPDYGLSPRKPWHLYRAADASVTNPMGTTDFWYDPRLSADGSRLLTQSGQVFDANFEFLGQLPDAAAGESWSRVALTPDGTKILALVLQGSAETAVRIDVFSTSTYVSGTTRFARTGSIAVTEQSSICSPYYYSCEYPGKLISTQDTVFWIGNSKLQVFKLP